MSSSTKLRLIAVFLPAVGAGLLIAWFAVRGPEDKVPPERDSLPLDPLRVEVVPTLDTPLPTGRSALWCASFQLAWKRLRKQLRQEPIDIAGAEEVCARLNAAPDPEADLPDGGFYANAGWVKDGIIEMVRRDMARLFPKVATPDLDQEQLLIAYSYLAAGVTFDIPFFDNREGFAFKTARGETEVSSFGLHEEHEYAYRRLREQVEVLFCPFTESDRPEEFIIDPCKTSRPNQLILARVERGPSLLEMVERVRKKIREARALEKRAFWVRDVLLIPEVRFDLAHRFRELEGAEKPLKNPDFEKSHIDLAMQSVRFALHKGGAELASEAKIYVKPSATHYVFDRPFLILLQQRGADRPYFALWIEDTGMFLPAARRDAH